MDEETPERFRDREEGGRVLATRLEHLRGADPIVLALPRGGVPVGRVVAEALGAPMDVWIVRKLGAPFQPELGVGALAEDGTTYVDPRAAMFGIDAKAIEAVATVETREVARRVAAYRKGRPAPDVTGRTVVLVDDGIATGGTARAAIASLRKRGAARVVLAAPVAAAESVTELSQVADEVVVALAPESMGAIGYWYDDFRQLDDVDVLAELDAAPRRVGSAGGKQAAKAVSVASPGQRGEEADVEIVTIPLRNAELTGELGLPSRARGVVVFAHGSGSGRTSPRNRSVARRLRAAGLGTLLLDLLTPEEQALDEVTLEMRFDVEKLAARLIAATDWLGAQARTADLAIGYYGASTGAAAALVAAALRPGVVSAVVSRGGRTDLAGPALGEVRVPTLLIVGGEDHAVLSINRRSLGELKGERELAIVPGATHLFEEPGAIEVVATRATRWLVEHLPARGAPSHV